MRGLVHLFEEPITGHRGRYTVDSRLSLGLARQLWPELEDPATRGRQVLRRVTEDPSPYLGPVPEEIILELGGDGGGARPARQGTPATRLDSVDEQVWAHVLAALSERDDALLTLGGGFHDPLQDMALEERIAAARRAGAHGIHVATTGAGIDRARASALLETGVDIVTVDLAVPGAEHEDLLPAGTPPFAERELGLEALLAARGDSADATLVVVSVVFDRRSAAAVEAFFDRWYGNVDRVLIRGQEGPRGERSEHSMGVFAPPRRTPCQRLAMQLRVECDGRVPLCDRDPFHETSVGDAARSSIAEIWRGESLEAARRAHLAGEWNTLHHCGACLSWFRFD